MATPISVTTPATTTDAREPAPNKALDRDAFLKILVAQVSHQDPLKPLEGTEFVAQLSQFAVVEQAISQSSKLDTLSSQIGGLANNEVVSLVGKVVELKGERVAFDGTQGVAVSRTLAAPAQQVTVRIQDSSGKTVRTIELGSRPAGALNVSWDGLDDAKLAVPAGQYSVQVEARDAGGEPVSAASASRGRVLRVTFDKGYPELHLDSGGSAPVSDLIEVSEK
jgi:flagellar basal-body rod modification protein FlgD